MKNNISYYRHEVDSHNHWKFKTLRRRYQWEGEGKFWALNNMIADAESCMLDLSDPDKRTAIATDLDFDLKEFDEFIDCLVHVCKLVRQEGDQITTGIVQEIYDEVNGKRKYQRNWKTEKLNSNQVVSSSKTRNSNSNQVVSSSKTENSSIGIVQEIYDEVNGKRKYQRNWKTPDSNSNSKTPDSNSKTEKLNSKTPNSSIEKEQSKVKEIRVKEIRVKEKKLKEEKKVNQKKEEGIATATPSLTHTPEEEELFASFRTWVDKYAPKVNQMKEPLTIKQYLKLRKDFPGQEGKAMMQEIILAMHNKKTLLKEYESANLTLRSWINHRRKNGHDTPAAVPAASGIPSPQRGLLDTLRYLYGRWQEGELNDNLIFPEYYDFLVARDMVPLNFLDGQPGETIEARKRQGVIAYFQSKSKPDVH